jgi:hypothetical protein
MNIEKIKNYNQIVLSIIGTIGVALGILALISFLFLALNDVFRVFDSNNDYQDPGIVTEESVNGDEGENANKLLVSYSFPTLIDTIGQVYLIPIGYKTNYELQDEYKRDLLSKDKTAETYGGYNSYDYSYSEQTYVNMVIYDSKTGISEILFKQKLLLGSFTIQNFKDDVFLLMEAALADTDKDGKITMTDNNSLFIYSTRNKSLKHLQYKDKSLINYTNIPTSKDYMVRFGIEPDRWGETKTNTDLSVICKYVYDQDQLLLVNDEKMQKELQEIVAKK